MNSNTAYLAHHGILKQKWGVRNGPPYPLKNSQRSSAEKRANNHSNYGYSKLKLEDKNVVDSTAREIDSINIVNGSKKDIDLNALDQTAKKTSEAIGKADKLRPKKKTDLSNYSDAELQRIVNRQRLEDQYNQMNPDKISKGAAYVRETVELIGSIAMIAYIGNKIINK